MEEIDDNFKSDNSSCSLIENNISEGEGKILNPESNDIESITLEDEFDYNYTPLNFRKINEKEEMIICVEMINNNKIYIRYQDNWTIKDVSFN